MTAVAPKPKKKPLTFLDKAIKKKSTVFTLPDDSEDDIEVFSRSKDYFPQAVREQTQGNITEFALRQEGTNRRRSRDDEDYDGSTPPKRAKVEVLNAWADEDIYGASPPPTVKPKADLVKPKRTPTPPADDISTPSSELKDVLRTPSIDAGNDSSHYVTPPSAPGSASTPKKEHKAQTSSPKGPTPSKLAPEQTVSLPGSRQEPVAIDDDDDIGALETPNSDEPKENDEMADFIRRAREQMKASAKLARPPSPATAGSGSNNDSQPPKARKPRPEKIKIFIYSRVSTPPQVNVRPWACVRTMDQDFRDVIRFWILYAGQCGLRFEPADESRLLLTWREQKVLTFSTPASLGLASQPGRRLQRVKGDEGFTPDGGALLLEIWAEQEYNEHVEKEAQKRMLAELGGDDEDVSEEADQAEKPPEDKLRIILQDVDGKSCRLTAYTNTPVRWLEAAWRKQQKVEAGKQIKLLYDGERLDLEQTLEDAEIDDQTTVEVYVS